MKIAIDLSLFVGSSRAFGNVHGQLDLTSIPRIGETIVLNWPPDGSVRIKAEGFSGHLRVTGVRYAPISPMAAAPVAIDLDDVVLASEEDARAVMSYLVSGFGLYGDEY